jgi:hypothetical protein
MKRNQVLFVLFFGIGILQGANNALTFDGTNDYISANGVATNLAGSSTLTMEAWFNSANVPSANDQMILAVNNSDGSINISHLDIETGKLKYTGSSSVAGSTTLSSNTWYHVALTLDASNNLNVYLNGNAEISTTETDRPNSGDLFSIGQEWDNSTASEYFDGKIDEVRIWNDVRTETEIRQNMYRELPDPASETDLVSYYKFNEASGTTATDSKGTNIGTLTNMAGTEWQTSPAMFGPKNALEFDGVNDYVTTGYALVNLANDMTIEAWFNTTNSNSYNAIATIEKQAGGGDNDFLQILTNSAGKIYLDDANNAIIIVTSESYNDGKWHHVAFVRDATNKTIYLYVDGVLKGSQTYTYSGATNPDMELRFGNSEYLSGSYQMDGKLDEIRIWSDVRTPSEIRENMCKMLTGNEPNLKGYYTFDNTSGTILQDFSGNGNDGTLTNMNPAIDWVASSAFNTWLNGGSSSWSTTANWSGGAAPVSTDNVGVYTYSGGTNVSLSSSPTVTNLVLGGSSVMTLSSGLTINGNLLLESNLDLNGQTITLGSSATLVEGTGHVSGSSGTLTTTRDLSNISAEDVAGLGAEITTSSNMGTTNILRGHGARGTQGIERYYQINPTTNTGLSATLVFNYRDAELNGQTESELKLFKSSDGSTWTEQSSSDVNTSSNTLTLTSIDAFSFWTAAPTGSDASLPVELSLWTAQSKSGNVFLNWTTDSEIENLGFIIERKGQNQKSYQEIASYLSYDALKGQGSSTQVTEYHFIDKAVEVGQTYFYRLTDIDYQGKRTGHAEISVVVKAADEKMLADHFRVKSCYPNPFNPSTTISYELTEAMTVTLHIFDVQGREIYSQVSEPQSAGTYEVQWNGKDANGGALNSGIYIARLEAGANYSQSLKLIYLQ